MKKTAFASLASLFTVALLASSAVQNAGAAELVYDEETLNPSSTLEVRFDEAMIPKDQVGKIADVSPLAVTPEVKGEFKWTSTRSGQFHFTGVPAMGTAYAFTLRAGLKNAQGAEVPADELGEFSTETFHVADQWKDYPYSYGNSAQRKAMFLLQFNDAVNVASFEKAFYWEAESGGGRIPATVRPATVKDFKRQYSPTIIATWEEQAKRITPDLKSSDTRPNALAVEATEALPVGKGWRLVVDSSLKNASGTAQFTPTEALIWGSVLPLTVKSISATTHFDSPHEIEVTFTKAMLTGDMNAEEQAAALKPFIKVSPEVPNQQVKVAFNSVSIAGDFQLNTDYVVTVANGAPGADGLPLESPVKEAVTFNPSEPFVSTSARISSLMSNGKGILDIYAANFKDLRVRVKQLTDADLLKARALHADSYAWTDDPKKAEKQIKDTPYENFPGTQVFEKTYPNEKLLQKSTVFQLNWREVLGQAASGPAFIEIVGTAQDGAPERTVINRAVVDFTDIGLLLKSSGEEALVFAFSLKTGKPLPNVQITLTDLAQQPLQTAQTDASGLASIPAKDAAWVLAKNGADVTALNFFEQDTRIGLYGQGIEIGWEAPWRDRLQTFIFADRPVYKPGDTAHVKAIFRQRSGDKFAFSAEPLVGQLIIRTPENRTLVDKKVTFSANGSWSEDIKLPEASVGWYTLQLKFPKKNADPKAEDDESDGEDRGFAYLDLRVDEYKPNSFEVALQGDKYKVEKDRLTVPLSARYYMGKPLSEAKISWMAHLEPLYTPPSEYADFHFGDADSWWHYGQDLDDETASEEAEEEPWGANGTLTLTEDGKASIELPAPPLQAQALPQIVNVYADVTDVNQQTISSTATFQIPGADFLVGAKKTTWYGTANSPYSLDLVAITPEGKPFTAPVQAQVKIERQEWNTVRVQGAGDATITKNQSTLIEESKTSVDLRSANNGASSGKVSFTPKRSGTYFMTLTAMDAQGKTILTRVPFYVIGGGTGFPWSWEDGAKMTLQPDKTTAKPGEEVSVVVKTPIAGTALVSVERNRVHRQFLAEISPENPVVKVKMTEEDGPNAFISVVVFRGAADSPQPDAMPEYKVGYCEIKVPSDTHRLYVDAKPSKDTVKPGEELTVTATVQDAKKQPVSGAEVTLYAVDEGVLSLMAYETPMPFEFFHASSPLGISNYTTLGDIIPESLKERYRGNKGVLVGGGGDEGSADDALRKNFLATAIWQAALTTDANGAVTTKIKVPDSLTRYRIMAIATKDAIQFGTGVSAFTVNKPLMVEPVVPRFAHVGDEILLKAVVHNTTKYAGQVEVELKLDGTAKLITESRPFAMVAIKNRTMTNDGKSERRVISLKPGETTALAFPVRFTQRGTATWQWRVGTTQWPGEALVDAVESKFEVTPPAPALREVKYATLTAPATSPNLLGKVNPQLLEGEGTVTVNFSRSRMGETRDAMEYLLHYPYGCVEQTTSSLLPWLALAKYEPLFPDLLEADKVKGAIQRGADRLMRMQLDEGGLSYWPGGTDAELWATAYGGFGLIKCKEWGIAVPQESIDKLTGWLSGKLRELDLAKTTDGAALSDAALALYTLAKAGKPEPSYQTMLFSRREKLPETARAFLALSMCLTNAPAKQIAELVQPAKTKGRWESFWLGPQTVQGLRLIVCAHLGLTTDAEAIANQLMLSRNGSGHWGTTFSNAWILTGLSTNEKPLKDAAPLPYQFAWGQQKGDGNLATGLSSSQSIFAFAKQDGAKPLTVTTPAPGPLRTRVEIKSWPDLKTFQSVSKGFGLTRTYERLTPVGTLEPAEDLHVGDLIVITLNIKVSKPNRYLAIEDPLPSVFEPINPEFTTQNTRKDAEGEDNAWYTDHRELRHDKALFFTNDWSQKGEFHLKYLARVIAEGDVVAPPARIEAMYEPEQYGLSDIQRILTLPMADGSDVAKK